MEVECASLDAVGTTEGATTTFELDAEGTTEGATTTFEVGGIDIAEGDELWLSPECSTLAESESPYLVPVPVTGCHPVIGITSDLDPTSTYYFEVREVGQPGGSAHC